MNRPHARQLSILLIAFISMGVTSAAVGQTANKDAIESGLILPSGNGGPANLYGSNNVAGARSYGITTFNFNPGDFGLSTLAEINSTVLNLTFNDQSFSEGTSFDILFTTDDFNSYTGLLFDTSGANDPNGVNPAQFSNLTSLGNFPLGFDITDESLGGNEFAYFIDVVSIENELLTEINSGSDFSFIVAAHALEDDITFSGVNNLNDPGAPRLEMIVGGVPEPGSLVAIGLFGITAMMRRRRS